MAAEAPGVSFWEARPPKSRPPQRFPSWWFARVETQLVQRRNLRPSPVRALPRPAVRRVSASRPAPARLRGQALASPRRIASVIRMTRRDLIEFQPWGSVGLCRFVLRPLSRSVGLCRRRLIGFAQNAAGPDAAGHLPLGITQGAAPLALTIGKGAFVNIAGRITRNPLALDPPLAPHPVVDEAVGHLDPALPVALAAG